MNDTPTVVNLFAGIHGCSLGFKRAGFRSLAAIDFDEKACEQGRRLTGSPTFCRDIAAMQPGELRELVGPVAPDVRQAAGAVVGIVAWTQDIEPYETTLNTAEQRGRFNALALAEVQRLLNEISALRARSNAADALEPPSILVLAGAPYIDGWADRARALGVRVDDPLRGYTLGDRRMFARRFVAETPAWGTIDELHDLLAGRRSPVGAPAEAEAAPGWGTRREQLLSFIDEFELERAPTMDEIAGERHATQVGLNFGSGSEATV